MIGFGDVEVGTGSGFQTVTVDVADDPDDGGPVLDDAGKDAVTDGAWPGHSRSARARFTIATCRSPLSALVKSRPWSSTCLTVEK